MNSGLITMHCGQGETLSEANRHYANLTFNRGHATENKGLSKQNPTQDAPGLLQHPAGGTQLVEDVENLTGENIRDPKSHIWNSWRT